VRVVIAEDSLLVRAGLVAILESCGITCVGETDNPSELLDLVAGRSPDVAIVDIRMPPTQTDEGIVAARAIRDKHPATAVLVLSHHLESTYAMRLVEENPGGVGYLLKDRVADVATLTDALRRLKAGECVVDPTIVGRLLRRARPDDPLSELTARERDVLAEMAEGRGNRAICERLAVSPKTLESHVNRIFTKLGLEDTPDVQRRVLAVLTYLRS
jgi:DNA-binding NarL/FixJ family response regulator